LATASFISVALAKRDCSVALFNLSAKRSALDVASPSDVVGRLSQLENAELWL